MTLSRRDFLRVSAAGSGSLVLALSFSGCSGIQTGYREEGDRWVADAWLEITGDNIIFFTLARVEMGQGTYTGLTTLIAEELDVEPASIRPKFAPVAQEYRNPLYKLQLTGGSTSLATSWEPLRRAGASARLMLVAAAAEVWQIDPASCRTDNGRVLHPDGRVLNYGQLAKLAAAGKAPENPELKPREHWKYIGRERGRLDARAKATGTAQYGIDVELPGMVYAVVTRPPRYGASVAGFDDSAVRAMPGVLDVFAIERGIAVVADKYWRARKAQAQLVVEWNTEEALAVSGDAVMDHYHRAADDDPGEEERREGDFGAGVRSADRVIEASYEQPFLAHATLEPMNAMAWYRGGRMEIWAPTQAPDLARIAVARVTDLSPDEVAVNTTFLGVALAAG